MHSEGEGGELFCVKLPLRCLLMADGHKVTTDEMNQRTTIQKKDQSRQMLDRN